MLGIGTPTPTSTSTPSPTATVVVVPTRTPTITPSATPSPRPTERPVATVPPAPTTPSAPEVDSDLPVPKLTILSGGVFDGQVRLGCVVPASERRAGMRMVSVITSVTASERSRERAVSPNSRGTIEFEREVDEERGQYARFTASCYVQLGNRRSRSSNRVGARASPNPFISKDASLGTPRLSFVSTNSPSGTTRVVCERPSRVRRGSVDFVLMVLSTGTFGESEEVLVSEDDGGVFEFSREVDERRREYAAMSMSCYMTRGGLRSELSETVRRGAVAIGR